ncbi:MAG: hypothetical protein ACPGQS_02895 [Bradymonadia bacterium]
MDIDYEHLTQELFKTLRGRSSQGAFSRRLGFQTNVAYRWESGLRTPNANDLLMVLDIRISAPRENIWRFASPFNQDEQSTSNWCWGRWLSLIKGQCSVKALSNATGLSAQAIRRIFRGDVTPKVDRLLQLIQVLTNRLLDFVQLFVDPKTLPSLASLVDVQTAQRALSTQFLNTELIIASLETDAYQALDAHSNQWIATHLQLELEEVTHTVDALKKTGGLYSVGQKLKTQPNRFVNTRRLGAAAYLRLFDHWNDTLTRRRTSEDYAAYLVFSCTQETATIIRDLLNTAVKDAVTRVSEDDSTDSVSALTVQLGRLSQ